MSTQILSFVPSAVAPSAHENATRERRPAREIRAKAMLATPASIEYLGPVILPEEIAASLAKGDTIAVAGSHVQAGKPGILTCTICQGTHGGKDFHKRPDLVAKTVLFRNVKTKQVFALSDTCRLLYFDTYAAKALTNPEAYYARFPRPVVKS